MFPVRVFLYVNYTSIGVSNMIYKVYEMPIKHDFYVM